MRWEHESKHTKSSTDRELLENEEQRFKEKKEKEYAVKMSKQLTPEQRKLVEGWEK